MLTRCIRSKTSYLASLVRSTSSFNSMTGDTASTDVQTGLYVPPSLAKRWELLDSSTSSSLLSEVSLVHLYTAACLYQWDRLPELAAQVHAHTDEGEVEGQSPGATEKVQAAIRHLVVFCGYGPCLAAMTALKKVDTKTLQRTIPYDTPGKVSSLASAMPNSDLAGNAFQLVYGDLSPKVRNTVYQADPVLENWIQSHLYGDVYSSPGLSMLSKQHLTIAGLVKSNMMEQLYGHALAALRFGGDVEFLKGVVDIVVWWQNKVGGMGSGDEAQIERIGVKSKRVIDMAVAKYTRMKEEGEITEQQEVVNPEGTVCLPDDVTRCV